MNNFEGEMSSNNKLYWCNTHERKATASRDGKPCCDRNLAGITMPCRVVDLTGLVEVIE